MLKHPLRAKTETKTETNLASSAAIPATLGVDTIGALRGGGSSHTLIQALVHGAIRPAGITLRAPMRMMMRVQTICDATDAHASMLREASRATLPQLAGTAMATLCT